MTELDYLEDNYFLPQEGEDLDMFSIGIEEV